MDPSHPIRIEYQKSIPDKIEVLKKAIANLKADYSLDRLQNFRKEVHKLAGNSGVYGYYEVSEICKQLEIDILAKIKNVNLTEPDRTWLDSLDSLIGKIEKGFALEGKQVPVKKELQAPKAEKKRVVVVDDDEDISNLLSYEFHELGFDVEVFRTGKEALLFLLNEENLKDVFLLILDRILPDMDGLDILQKFMDKFPGKVPVLMISVLSSERDIISGLQGGAIDYITKPFSVFMLMQRALNLLKSSQGR